MAGDNLLTACDINRIRAIHQQLRSAETSWSDGDNRRVTVFQDPRTGKRMRDDAQGFLTAGERGYIASMRSVFQQALLQADTTTVLVLDDDAVFLCNLQASPHFPLLQ